jgi:DinB superfamily
VTAFVPAITPYLELLERTRAALLAEAEAIPDENWRTSPGAGRWSTAEVFAHLLMVESRVMQGAAKVISAPAMAVPWWGRLHVPVQLAQWRFKRVESPVPLDGELLGGNSEERLLGTRENTLEFIRGAGSRDLRPYRLQHPFLGSLNVCDWFRMIAYHEARHTKQICDIARSMRNSSAPSKQSSHS